MPLTAFTDYGLRILMRLASAPAGILSSAELARELGLGYLVRLLEADQALVACLAAGDAACCISDRCRLQGRLRAAERAFLADLDRSSLADIALPAKGRAATCRADGPGDRPGGRAERGRY